VAGWYWPASTPELAGIALTRAVLFALSKNDDPAPLAFLFPWNKPPRAERVTRADVEQAEARLRRFTAFRD